MRNYPTLLMLPAIFQSVAVLSDELVFHRKRGLPRWERLGHPLDTLSVVACLLWLLTRPFTPHALAIYVLLALFSTLLVTKDEWVHASHCPPGEHWLHSILFALHPMMLGAAAGLWFLAVDGKDSGLFFPVIGAQAALAASFAVYQAVYWNFRDRRSRA
ncbi:MAG: hypothetical protein NDJ89_12495 [Oligoflexia bacterium]|nr:hypothetical protein [Oligoflexia bacterium]